MTCKELIEYLSGFAPDEQVSIVIGNPEERVRHIVSKVFLIEGYPAIFLESIESEPLDEFTVEC